MHNPIHSIVQITSDDVSEDASVSLLLRSRRRLRAEEPPSAVSPQPAPWPLALPIGLLQCGPCFKQNRKRIHSYRRRPYKFEHRRA